MCRPDITIENSQLVQKNAHAERNHFVDGEWPR